MKKLFKKGLSYLPYILAVEILGIGIFWLIIIKL